MPNSRPQLSELVAKYREKRGLGLRALAKRVGVDPVTVMRWEHGTTQPDAELLQKLADALEVPARRLFAAADRVPAELPAFPIYLRAKYRLTEEQVEALEEELKRIRAPKAKKGGGHGKRPS